MTKARAAGPSGVCYPVVHPPLDRDTTYPSDGTQPQPTIGHKGL